tara:strand:- start:92 stop:514 length:423 start_codon:yes stop_codon:yes gene_type:complete
MIIKCPNCQKTFEVDSSLIPDKGRIIQCGSCNHTWNFNKKNLENKTQNLETKISEIEIKPTHPKVKDIKKNKSQIKKKFLGLNKILSYLLVFIITFIALIILIDTFKIPLSKFFPQIELIIFNLFETLIDIYLFLKNLLF